MSSIAPLRTLGCTRLTSFFPWEMSWLSLCLAMLLISFVAALIIPGAASVAWLTVSLPIYAKSYLLRHPPSCLFLLSGAIRLFLCFILFFFDDAYWNFNFFVSTTRKPRGLFLLINMQSSNDLFNISNRKWCSPLNTLILLHLIKQFEFLGKKQQFLYLFSWSLQVQF